MSNESDRKEPIAKDLVKPIDTESETSELLEQDLNKVAGGQTKVVGSSSNIKNN